MMEISTHLWKCFKLVEIFDTAEELQTDTGGDDEQAHGEQYQAAEFFPRTKDLQHNNTLFTGCL